jgi:hypothetical protein
VELDEDPRHGCVDADDVAGVAGDDGVVALPSAKYNVDVHDVVVAGGRAHQPVWFDLPDGGELHAVRGVSLAVGPASASAWSASPAAARPPRSSP